MKIKISNNIEITGANIILKRNIKEALTIANPMYQTMVRAGNHRALYNIPENFEYFEEKDDAIIVGRGIESRLRNYKFEYDVLSPKIEGFTPNKDYFLRDYQEGVPEEIIKNNNGIIKLGTGFGKTHIALYIAYLLGVKTLFVTHRSFILKQFVKTAKEHYNYDLGVIQGKTNNIKGVTVAMVGTLGKRDIEDQFGLIIYDECHTAVTKKNTEIVQRFSPKYLYGMSGTPDRSDGQGEAIKFMFGKIIIDKALPAATPEVKIMKSNYHIPITEYAEMISYQVNLQERNELIGKVIENQYGTLRKMLVLTKRIEHYKNIKAVLPKHIKAYELNSRDDNTDLLEGLRYGKYKYDVLLGTFSLLSTGVDIDTLDTLIIAGDLKSNVLTTQSIGRVIRLKENKKTPRIIDIADTKNGILYRQFLERRKVYAYEIGSQINYLTDEEIGLDKNDNGSGSESLQDRLFKLQENRRKSNY